MCKALSSILSVGKRKEGWEGQKGKEKGKERKRGMGKRKFLMKVRTWETSRCFSCSFFCVDGAYALELGEK